MVRGCVNDVLVWSVVVLCWYTKMKVLVKLCTPRRVVNRLRTIWALIRKVIFDTPSDAEVFSARALGGTVLTRHCSMPVDCPTTLLAASTSSSHTVVDSTIRTLWHSSFTGSILLDAPWCARSCSRWARGSASRTRNPGRL